MSSHTTGARPEITYWEKITRAQRDEVVSRMKAEPDEGGLTIEVDRMRRIDGDGPDCRYGPEVTRTTWKRGETAILLDVDWPTSDQPCEHYALQGIL